jgi:hypothetical protein
VPSRPWPEVRDELLARDAARVHAHLRQIPRCADVVVTALDLDVTSKTAGHGDGGAVGGDAAESGGDSGVDTTTRMGR